MGQTESQVSKQEQAESETESHGSWSTKKVALSSFSNSLVPSDEFRRSGKAAANYIFNILKTSRKDVVIGGSTGKKTSIDNAGQVDLRQEASWLSNHEFERSRLECSKYLKLTSNCTLLLLVP